MNLDSLAEEGTYDPVGTVRVGERHGSVGVYVKVDDDTWVSVYVDPRRSEHLVSDYTLSETTVGMISSICYTPSEEMQKR